MNRTAQTSPKQVQLRPRKFLAALLGLSFAFAQLDLPLAAAADKKPPQDPVLKGLPITELNANEAILHALNRLAYGPRPGDVDRVRQMGLAKWIDQQLNPKSIDESAVEARLSIYPTLQMPTTQLMAEYPQPKQAAVIAAKAEARQQQQTSQGQTDAAVTAMANGATITDLPASDPSMTATATPRRANASATTDTPSPMKLNPPTRGAGGKGALSVDPNAVPPAISDDSKRPPRVIEELSMAKLTRAVYSERQLQQVMDDFWLNHFNVFAGKGEDKWYLTSYERDVIQPRVFGKFKDLVTATAQSPAMLFYLDNFLSADPNAAARQAALKQMHPQRRGIWGQPMPPRPQQHNNKNKKQDRGLNENYGRELMELHTLGVDGGYTQRDVTELARMLTGWTFAPRFASRGSTFVFAAGRHDFGTKTWLGRAVEGAGESEGELALDVLASHPSTARHIAFKLAQFFVADTPPPALVERVAKQFTASGGDIRSVLGVLFASPEFRNPANIGAKFKTPYHYVVSAVRAADVKVNNVRPLLATLNRMGMPLYGCATPDGYKNTADVWLNPGALSQRIDFATAIGLGRNALGRIVAEGVANDPYAAGPARAMQVAGDAVQAAPQPARPVDFPALLATVGAGISAENRERIATAQPEGLRSALVLGSPDFMRR